MGKPDAAIREMRARFERVTERRGVSRVREAYEVSQARAVREVARAARPYGAAPLTASTRQLLLAHVRNAHVIGTRDLAAEIATAQSEAHVESLRGLARFVRQMEGRGSALDTQRAFDEVIARRRTALMDVARHTVARQSVEIVNSVGAQLTRAAVAGRSVGQAVRDVEASLDGQFYRIERAVRTQASYAYNAAVSDGIESLAKERPDIRTRWVEHVSDASWAPLDNRVGADSIALHGQLKKNGFFTMPPDGPVHFLGQTYDFPPNRPNDRAVVMPWRKAWGIPAYELNDGRRRWLVGR